MNKFLELLNSKEIIILDGAMGTMLFSLGLKTGESPELWNDIHPEYIGDIHQKYIDAGAQIIITNSFGGTNYRLKRYNLENRVYELNKKAAQIAKAEADKARKLVAVGGSVGPLGELLKPYGKIEYDEAKSAFAEQAKGLADGCIDVFWIETMGDLNEVNAAIEGIRSVSDLPISVTMSFDTHGKTMMGVTPTKAADFLAKHDVNAIGGNCGRGPVELISAIKEMHELNLQIPLVAKTNAGLPKMIDQQIVYDGTPEIMKDYALKVREAGARLIGACCGSTPDHIRAINETINN
ncbi:MAG: betaine--homocysteine S-methyltransferase [Chloroflexi bacterium]|nr:betaine--homocysteine S-methyltransferase [Chloroflexota bacterium]